MSNNQLKSLPIGVFDSGLGGLCALKEIKRLLPGEDIIYFGDTARVPYGTKTPEVIKKYALSDARFLLSHNVKAIVIACGTVSSVALGEIKESCDIPIIDVVSPAARAALKYGENGKIAILGTQVTIHSHSFDKLLEGKAKKLFPRACPLFVPLVENGYIGDSSELTRLACREYLSDIAKCEPDATILGCTHFPLIAPAIQRELPNSVLIDTGKEAARELEKTLTELDLLNSSGGRVEVYTSDEISSFERVAKNFLGEVEVNYNKEKIEIEKY